MAALSHPNILAIHDFGNDHGVSYAVTELLEGETLRSHVGRNALPWRKAVEVGIAIADGLAIAHSKGIIHRDLKPENLFLTSDGRVKILDFGLARWAAPSTCDPAEAPTLTQENVILGTAGYMSPEQLQGKPADARSDIFSLGCVLYEMVAGRRAFSRETSAQTLAAILEAQPPELASMGKHKKIRVDGGEPISLCDAPQGRGASWGEDGAIVAALDTLVGLSQVPSEGGKPVSVTTLSLGETTHRWPQILPGGRGVLFNASSPYGYHDDGIAVVSLKDRRTKTVVEHAGMFPRYLPNGYLVYVTKGTLVAAPFDPERLEVRGTATPLQEASSNTNLGSAQLDFSRSGILAFRTFGQEGLSTIQWLIAWERLKPSRPSQPPTNLHACRRTACV